MRPVIYETAWLIVASTVAAFARSAMGVVPLPKSLAFWVLVKFALIVSCACAAEHHAQRADATARALITCRLRFAGCSYAWRQPRCRFVVPIAALAYTMSAIVRKARRQFNVKSEVGDTGVQRGSPNGRGCGGAGLVGGIAVAANAGNSRLEAVLARRAPMAHR